MQAIYYDNIHIVPVSLAAPLVAPFAASLHIPQSGREFLQSLLEYQDVELE